MPRSTGEFTTEPQSHREKRLNHCAGCRSRTACSKLGARSSKLFLCVSVTLWLVGVSTPVRARAEDHVTFRDITAQAGIHFTHNNGAFGQRWLPETMGPGCAFIDYDNDGYPDILLVNGTDWPRHPKNGATTVKFYHNNHDGTFTDVTRKSGLDVSLFGLGVAVGD